MDISLNAVQWPAMAVTLLATWLLASPNDYYRKRGFWCFMASNVLWIVWGWHDAAYGLITLQIGLFMLNVRGVKKTDEAGPVSST